LRSLALAGVALVAILAMLAMAPLAMAQAQARAAAAAVLPDPFPGVARGYVVQVDGVERWGFAADTPLPPASLTKLMTALVVVETKAAALDGEDVTISPRAAAIGGARLGLRAGESMRAGDLLAAMLLHSANDACAALAEWTAGSERTFVARMNARAAAMGLAHAHFVNACGFDAPGHEASARDLAALVRAFMAEPRLAALARTESAVVRTRGGRSMRIANTNALLGRVPGAIGAKTGYTSRAGRCLAVIAERHGVRVVAVLLGAGDRWWDAAAMIERAFDAAR
jgi:D-alanyl-D-alanine carboxypeptidase (penicillin-binding protein 5/6)